MEKQTSSGKRRILMWGVKHWFNKLPSIKQLEIHSFHSHFCSSVSVQSINRKAQFALMWLFQNHYWHRGGLFSPLAPIPLIVSSTGLLDFYLMFAWFDSIKQHLVFAAFCYGLLKRTGCERHFYCKSNYIAKCWNIFILTVTRTCSTECTVILGGIAC